MINNIINYICNLCNYTTVRKNNFVKHLTTEKHIKKSSEYVETKNKLKTPEEIIKYHCLCGAQYRHRQSLNKHKKNCQYNNMINQDVVLKLIEQNNKLTDMIVEQNKQLTTVTPNINNTTNITNTSNTMNCKNKFNIQIFLHEKCKNAISIDEFIKSIQISLQNLLVTKDKGLAEGITNIFIENMIKLPLTERPLHCTDTKREIIYVKNENWEKDENKEHIKNAIKKVSNIQSKNINIFKHEKPNFMENQKDKDDYIDLVKNATDNISEKDDKIIKTICKNVYINETAINE
jgi:hypothetical protein